MLEENKHAMEESKASSYNSRLPRVMDSGNEGVQRVMTQDLMSVMRSKDDIYRVLSVEGMIH